MLVLPLHKIKLDISRFKVNLSPPQIYQFFSSPLKALFYGYLRNEEFIDSLLPRISRCWKCPLFSWSHRDCRTWKTFSKQDKILPPNWRCYHISEKKDLVLSDQKVKRKSWKIRNVLHPFFCIIFFQFLLTWYMLI